MRGLRKSVRKRLRWICIIVAVQLFLLCLWGGTVKQITEKKYNDVLAEKEMIIAAAERTAYVTTEPVRAGEVFSEKNVEKRYVLAEQEADTLKTDAIGSIACVDLPAGVILNTSVCRKEQYDATDRRCTFQKICYAECFEEYEIVDVRIRYGNGENYCVLKKKRLLPTGTEGGCCFVLNETEQLLMSGAEFDIEVYEGAELYLVGILDEWEEGEHLSMFLPSEQVLLQLQGWEGKDDSYFKQGLELRKALETRLAEHKRKKTDGEF